MYIRSYKIIQRTVDHEKSGFIDPSIVHMDHGWLSDKPHVSIALLGKIITHAFTVVIFDKAPG